MIFHLAIVAGREALCNSEDPNFKKNAPSWDRSQLLRPGEDRENWAFTRAPGSVGSELGNSAEKSMCSGARFYAITKPFTNRGLMAVASVPKRSLINSEVVVGA